MQSQIQLLQVLPAAVLITRKGIVRFANTASVQLLQATDAQELVGRVMEDFVHPLDKDRSALRIQQLALSKGQANKPSEFRLRTLRGELRMVLISSISIEWEGKPAELMTGMDRTHASEIEDQLRASEKNYRRLFDNIQEVYYRTDSRGVMQHVGPGARRVMGYEPSEVEGHSAQSFYPPDFDGTAFKAAIFEKGEVADFPGRVVRRDGTVIDISISSHVLYDHAGNFSGIEGIYRDVTQRKNLERELQRLATTDMLTGIANRRAFLECARDVFEHSRSTGAPLTLLMLDLDHFKSINDRFGHLEGDLALIAFAEAVKKQLRGSDVVGRLGGEEFGVLLPRTALQKGMEVAERILQSIRSLDLKTECGEGYGITASAGVGTLCLSDRSPRDILDRADQALYQAKHKGRDAIVSLEPLGELLPHPPRAE